MREKYAEKYAEKYVEKYAKREESLTGKSSSETSEIKSSGKNLKIV